MGSRSSKRTDGTKPPKREKEKRKGKKKNNPRLSGSTQSVNIDDDSVNLYPDPSSRGAYAQPEGPHTLPRYHSSEDVSGRGRPVSQPPPIGLLPPSHPPNQEHRMQTQPQFPTFEETPRQVNSAISPRSRPPPVPNNKGTHKRVIIIPRYHSVDYVSDRGRPVSQPPPIPPPSDPHNQEHRMQTQSQFNTFEETPRQANPAISPRRRPPPVSNNKETLAGRKDSTGREDDGRYLGERKKKTVYHEIETEKKRNSDHFYDSPESNTKSKLRAERNYESNHENDISLRKGDILQLLTEGAEDGWYFVKNLTTRDEGYVHKDCVSMVTSHDVESQKCFFEELGREEAEEKLMEPHVELGTYLLRPGADGYVLSLRCQTELYELEIRHYKLKVAQEGICYLETELNRKPFSNITELIRYYSDKPGLRCKLKKPLPQDVPLNDLAVRFSDLKLGDQLGSGNFGYVFAGTLHGNRQVAVKSLRDGGSMTVEEFRNEAETMHKLRHPNLVSLLAICEYRGKIHIITEKMSRGSLQALLRKDSGSTVNFQDLMQMAIQVIDGMCYLERKGFIHRDLRAANVLVGDENITKIADFGLTRLLDSYYEHEDFYQDKKGTVFPYKWTAPEAINQLKFTIKSDVWSFGILLYEMVTYGNEPYPAMSNREVLEWVEKGNRLKKPTGQHNCPVTLYNIMKQCWLINSSERPNFADIRETLIEIKSH